jgi:hypothetical protein
MSVQREQSLGNFLSETGQLKETVKAVLPSYAALLKGMSHLPEEFERRFWASCVDALLEKVRGDHQEYQAQTRKARLYGKLITLAADIVLKAGGLEPMPFPDSLRVGISLHSSGEIQPALIDDPIKQPGAIVVTYERFVAIVQKLEDDLLKGTIVPTSEDEIPKLVYDLR